MSLVDSSMLGDASLVGNAFEPIVEKDVLVLTFDTGQRLHVTDSVLFGRNLQLVDAPRANAVFALPDLSRTLSKNHALLEWDGKQLRATDLGSTNGTALVGLDGNPKPLIAGERTPVPVESKVALGERWLNFTVRPRAVNTATGAISTRKERRA